MKGLLIVGLVGTLAGIELLGCFFSEGAELGRGKALYSDRCEICHGRNGDGKGPAGSSFNPRPAAFNKPKLWQENSTEKIAEAIKNGRGPMPAFDLKPDAIQAIIDYMVRSFKKGGK